MVHSLVLVSTMFPLRLVPRGVVEKGVISQKRGIPRYMPCKHGIPCYIPRYMPCNHTTLYTTLYAVKYAGPPSLPPAAAAAAAARDSSALPYTQPPGISYIARSHFHYI